MVWIEPGTFMMGTTEEQMQLMISREIWDDGFEDELPAHYVTITRGFWLGKYEVTQGQWESVMGSEPWGGQSYVQDSPNNPAVFISWLDVQQLIGKLNKAEGVEVYRLPMEAEWEYACRAGTTTRWTFGDDESRLTNYAWYKVNAGEVGESYAHEVGTKLPNPWGLYDMHGDVWEWCQDWYVYGSYSSSPQTDPAGPSTGSYRVIRGGDFNCYARGPRSANRYFSSPDSRFSCYGARLLRMDSPTFVSPTTWGAIKAQF